MEEGNLKKRGMPTQGERNIWKFYEWAVILAPIALMLSHWWIFYGFSQNTHEVMHYPAVNEPCIAWLYSIVYLYVPLMILPASYFFKWCNLFRIPFVYFLFINVERWYYGSWFCTNEMIDTHYILIYCIVCIYIFELTELALRKYKRIIAFAKELYKKLFRKTKEEQDMEDQMIDGIVEQMNELDKERCKEDEP